MAEELGQQHYMHGYMLHILQFSVVCGSFSLLIQSFIILPAHYFFPSVCVASQLPDNFLLGLCCLKGCDDQHYMCTSVICSPSSYANCDEDCIRTHDQDFIIRYSHNSFTTPICIGMWYTALCSCVTACQQDYVEVPLLCDVIMHQNAIMLALMYAFIMREQRERTAIIHIH